MKLKDSTFAIIAEKKDSISHKWFKGNNEVTPLWTKKWYYLYKPQKGYYEGFGEMTSLPKNTTIYTESEFEALLKAEQRKDFLMLTSLQIEAIQNPINYTVVWAKDGNGKIINKEGEWCYNNKWIFIESEGLRNLPPKMTQEQYEKINILKAEQEEEKQAYKKIDEIIVPQIIELNQFKADNPNATEKEIDKKLWELAKKYTNTLLTQKPKAEQENEPKNTAFGSENIAHIEPLTAKVLNEPKQITKVIKHRYSGKKSEKFWDIVNSIENEADRQELYSLGVMLQNSEEYVLRQLKNLNLCTVTKD